MLSLVFFLSILVIINFIFKGQDQAAQIIFKMQQLNFTIFNLLICLPSIVKNILGFQYSIFKVTQAVKPSKFPN